MPLSLSAFTAPASDLERRTLSLGQRLVPVTQGPDSDWPGEIVVPIDGTSDWLHAVDDGTPGRIVLSSVTGERVWLAAIDPRAVKEIHWEPVGGDPQGVGAKDIWHVFQFGHHWVSFSFEYKVNESDTELQQVLRLAKVKHDGDGGFTVVDTIWIVNTGYGRMDNQGQRSLTWGDKPILHGRSVDSQGHSIEEYVDATNDHYLVAWPPGPNSEAGLAVGLKSSYYAGEGTQFIHLDAEGNYLYPSFVGWRMNQQPTQLKHEAPGGSGWGQWLQTGGGLLPKLQVVCNLFVCDTLQPNAPSAIRFIRVLCPGLQATKDHSTPGLLESTTVLSDEGWNYAMATGRWVSGRPGHWLLTWRGRHGEGCDDNGDIYRAWFDAGWKKVGATERLTTGGIANRPHTLGWSHAGKRYIITVYDAKKSGDCSGAQKGMLRVDEVVDPQGFVLKPVAPVRGRRS